MGRVSTVAVGPGFDEKEGMRCVIVVLSVLLVSSASHADTLVPALRVDENLWQDTTLLVGDSAALFSAVTMQLAGRDGFSAAEGSDAEDRSVNTRRLGESETSAPMRGTASAGLVAPKQRTFGLGILFGGPTALTAKYALTRDQALQFGLGVGLGGRYFGYTFVTTFAFYLDYLWSAWRIVDVEPMSLNFYIGGGGSAAATTSGSLLTTPFVAARMPLGVSMLFKPIPLEVFLELAPTITVLPGIGLGVGGGLGVRWFF